MNTKPAARLPTLTGPVPFGASRFELQGGDHHFAVFRSIEEARIVRHRCNAYPRLEAERAELVALVRDCWSHWQHGTEVSAAAIIGDTDDPMRLRVRALLAKLGEGTL